MKRYLKDYVLTATKVEEAIYDCLDNKWRRKDVSYFLAEYMMEDGDNIHTIAKKCRNLARYKETRYLLYDTITKAAWSLCEEISNRNMLLKPIEYQIRYDWTSEKYREIGITSIKQQVYDYVAVNACKEMFNAKFGFYQCASIKNRGQVFGKKAIESWVRKDSKNTTFFYKCDIKQYYSSVGKRKLKSLLRRDIKDEDILYLIFTLLDTYKDGLCIGSYLSQYLANYYLSYLYHHITENSYSYRTKKSGKKFRVNHFSHVLFYMDDIILFGSNKKLMLRGITDFKNYVENVLGLTIKQGDGIYKTSTTRIDMMGYGISIKNTIIRRRIFRKIFRLFLRVKRVSSRLSIHMSRRILSYNGWIKHSNLYNFIKRFRVQQIVNTAKKEVSYHDKIKFYRNAEQI